MNKFCIHCGTALREEALFCPNCGTKKEIREELPTPEITVCQKETANRNVDIGALIKKTYTWVATQAGKRKKLLLIVGVAIVAVVAIALMFGNKGSAPFFGVERGDPVKTVEQKMGDPDDFENNGSQNYRYYYEDIKFLKMEGYVDIHFELDRVNTLRFIDSSASMRDYDDAVKYYTKQYGKPIGTNSNYSDYYSASEIAFWNMDDGSMMSVEYHSSAAYEPPTLTVYVYN